MVTQKRDPLVAWADKEKLIDTQWGKVTYENFCILECKRRGRGYKVYTKGRKICVDLMKSLKEIENQ